MLSLSLLSLWLPAPAQAFCGTYIGGADAQLFNNASQVVMAREGNRTALTVANDVQGDSAEFAMVIPVPLVLGPEDVRVIEPEIFDRLDGYSAPRLVRYECADFQYDDDESVPESDDGSETGADADGSVTVEAEFTAGEYDIVVLSAQESEGLLTWLNDNGYAVSPDAEGLLQEYIDAGSFFLAAQVSLVLGQEGQASGYLSPLQFAYESEVFSLPIRIGTINSSGSQDLILYTLTDETDGEVRISNYPQVQVPDDCLWDESTMGAFGDFYLQQFSDALADNGAAWAVEYSWTTSGCDPCSQEPLSEEELRTLGYEGDAGASHFTRLHARYSAEDAHQDLLLYASGERATEQIRYIEYLAELEDIFPVCGLGLVDDPGSCDDTLSGDSGLDEDPPKGLDSEPRFSCSSTGGGGLGGGLLLTIALLGVTRRRR